MTVSPGLLEFMHDAADIRCDFRRHVRQFAVEEAEALGLTGLSRLLYRHRRSKELTSLYEPFTLATEDVNRMHGVNGTSPDVKANTILRRCYTFENWKGETRKSLPLRFGVVLLALFLLVAPGMSLATEKPPHVFPSYKEMTVGAAWKALAPVPKLEDYNLVKMRRGAKAKNVDLTSHPDAKKFRTVLAEGFKADPAFAGYYIVIQNGCGSGCTMNWIVDMMTGGVLDMLYSSCGVAYDIKSNLFIVDTMEGFKLGDSETMPVMCNPQFYELKNDKPVLIKSLFPPETP